MRAVIVGGGAIGLACAYYARRNGWAVVVVDPVEPGSRASAHNAGWIVPSMSTPVPAPGVLPQAIRWMLRADSPLYITPTPDPRFVAFLLRMLRNSTGPRFRAGVQTLARLSRDALTRLDELHADGVEFEMHADPLTMLFSRRSHLDAHANELHEMESIIEALRWELLEPDELATRHPLLSPSLAGGIRTFGDRSVDPSSFTAGLEAACRRDGVEFAVGEHALLRRDGRGAVEAAVGARTIRADRYVVAAGVWSNTVLAPIGERISLQAGKGYGYDFPHRETEPAEPLYLSEAKVAVTPLARGVRLAGTMGFGDIDERVRPTRARGLLTGAAAYFADWPDVGRAPEPWVGLRPMTPDGLPVIGRARRHPNVLIATGHAMLGISLAAPTGVLISDLLASGPGESDRGALSATRF